jgi:hypothetical protein
MTPPSFLSQVLLQVVIRGDLGHGLVCARIKLLLLCACIRPAVHSFWLRMTWCFANRCKLHGTQTHKHIALITMQAHTQSTTWSGESGVVHRHTSTKSHKHTTRRGKVNRYTGTSIRDRPPGSPHPQWYLITPTLMTHTSVHACPSNPGLLNAL